MTMFDNYPGTNMTPDNRHKHRRHFHLDIMTGENATHVFEVSKSFMDTCSSVEVMYKQGIKIILTKQVDPNDVTDGDDTITIKLAPEETELFRDNILDTSVQLKFKIKETNDTMFSEIYKVKVTNSLKTFVDGRYHKEEV